MTFLTALLQIVLKAPQILGIIKSIIDVIGSEQVQQILEAIRESLKQEAQSQSLPRTETERERLGERLRRRINNQTLTDPPTNVGDEQR